MALADVVWVIDTSSILQIRRSTQAAVRRQVFDRLTQLVAQKRLVYPPEVVDELKRNPILMPRMRNSFGRNRMRGLLA